MAVPMKELAALSLRLVVTAVAIAVAAFVGTQLWIYYLAAPWTRDGRSCSFHSLPSSLAVTARSSPRK